MKFWIPLLSIVSLILSSNVNAALIDTDWQMANDNLIISDTNSGLNWLDLSVTASLSHDSVVANLESGGIFQGFQLATQVEVLNLWANAGITNYERTWVTNQFDPVKDLVERLGATVMVEEGLFTFATHTIGMAEGGLALPQNERWAMELTYAPDNLNSRTSTNHYTWSTSVADPHYSTYLVQAVPVPSAVWLFGSGLVGLVGFARRKKA